MRLKLREVIDQIIGYNYGKNAALTHYLHKSEPIPVWVFLKLFHLDNLDILLVDLAKNGDSQFVVRTV